MKNINELEIDLEKAEKAYDAKESTWDYQKSYDDFMEFMENDINLISKIKHEISLLKPIEWFGLPKYGDLMPINVWIDYVNEGMFIDYDGFGHYSSDVLMSNKTVSPSDIENGWLRNDKEFTHILWFNK